MKRLLPQFGMVLLGASLLATAAPHLAQQTEANPAIDFTAPKRLMAASKP